MAEVIQPIYHDIDLGFDTEDVKRVSVKQDSDKTQILVVKIYTNEDQMELDPLWEYHITMKKPDGKMVVDTENIEVRNNIIYITCTAQMLSAPGTSVGELVIYNNNQSLYTNNFYIYVDDDLISGDEIESTDEFNSLVSVLRRIQQYEQEAQASASNALASENAASTSAGNAADYEAQILAILNSLSGYDDQITTLMTELQNKTAEIEGLKRNIQDAVDDVTNLLQRLENMGISQIEDIVNGARTLYDELQNINNSAREDANSISDIVSEVTGIQSQMNDKYELFNTKYNEFVTKTNEVNARIASIDEFLDSMDSIKSNVLAAQATINDNKDRSNEDVTTITNIKSQAQELLEQLQEIVGAASVPSGGGDEEPKFDPIIVSDDQPGASMQEKDDMWLSPYTT